jgi:predicted Holliday junction resolvase-like endonuclease
MKNSILVSLIVILTLAVIWSLYIIREQKQELVTYERDLKTVIKKHNELNHENLKLRIYIVSIEKEMNENKYGEHAYD